MFKRKIGVRKKTANYGVIYSLVSHNDQKILKQHLRIVIYAENVYTAFFM